MAEIPEGQSRETAIRRDAEGRWFDGVEPIEHPGIIKAFESWLDRAEDGRYILKNSANWAYVAIEGAPMFVRRAIVSGAQVHLELSGDRVERLEPRTLRQDRHGQIYCDVLNGRFVAGFTRQAAFDLAEIVEEDAGGVHLRLGPERFSVPVVEAPLG